VSLDQLAATARSEPFGDYLTRLLVEICRVDTTPQADVQALGRAEAQVCDILASHVAGYGLAGLRSQRLAINPGIAAHPFFSQPYYTVTPARPTGLSAAETYRGRSNLLLIVDGAGDSEGASGDAGGGAGVNQAINAHIDVVRPYIAPRAQGGKVLGRGACDDKGAVVAFMGALKLIGQYLNSSHQRLAHHLTGMIVIEEEMGGNGSLSLAMDRQLKSRYDSLMVLECCGSRLHPGNRGALWYKVEARCSDPSVNLFEAAAFIVEEMENEGRAIKAESRHELFPHRPVQTCHGIIGNYGEHPSRINGRVDFDIHFGRPIVSGVGKGAVTGAVTGAGQSDGGDRPAAARARVRALIGDVIDSAIAQYVGLYGDKTQVKDAAGKPKVDHHYDLVQSSAGDGFSVCVHGASGHMGSILQNDGAITKMATIVRALSRSGAAIAQAAGAEMQLQLHGWPDAGHLLMEGGQGFLPTHDMPQIMQRLRQAVVRGAETYLRLFAPSAARAAGAAGKASECFIVSFDKLHNAAFAGATDSPDIRHALAAAEAAGIPSELPLMGWDVSCDARIFACEYPGMPVLTGGPGALACAHSDAEQVDMAEVARYAEFLAYFILKQTGTVG
jgi:acetylornithine deacetylase/succinyl-diaminopimelate desuccinylase-like protein